MSKWMDRVASGAGRTIGTHEQAQLISGEEYGLRNVLRHAVGTEKTEFPLDKAWHSGSDNPRGEMGIVNYRTPANNTLSVTGETVDHSSHQRWDQNYPGPGVTGPAEDGPAVKRLRER